MIFLASSSVLQADNNDNIKLKGNFEFGYRYVDVNGNIDKYYEDLNFRQGPRLLGLNTPLTVATVYSSLTDGTTMTKKCTILMIIPRIFLL